MTIRFPNLHFYVEDVPRAYRILGMEFTLFGAMIAAGMFLGLLVIWVQAGRQKKNVNKILGGFLYPVLPVYCSRSDLPMPGIWGTHTCFYNSTSRSPHLDP